MTIFSNNRNITNLRKAIGEKIFGNVIFEVISEIESFFRPMDKIIDLGAGNCRFTKLLKDKGYDVQPVDVKDRSYHKEIAVHVYDGVHLPFKDSEFDICLLKSVLHHTSDPKIVLKEAVRVSKKIVIYENVVTNIFQRYITYFSDCVMNQELIQPYTHKTDKEWRYLFNELELDLVKVTDKKTWYLLQDKVYYLKKL